MSVDSSAFSGFLSQNNSTDVALGSSETFTGLGDECLDYSSVTIMTYSDVASASSGVKVQFSSDGTNWDYEDLQTASVGANSFAFSTVARYVRVVYINGTSVQSEFRLITVFHKSRVNVGASTASPALDSSVAIDDESTLIRIAGQYEVDVARNIITGHNSVNKFGRNTDIDIIDAPVDIWNISDFWPEYTAGTVDVRSTSTNDVDTTGTGARTVFLDGITTGDAQATETISMNGTSAVTSANTYKYINSIRVVTSGSNGAPDGTIIVEDTGVPANQYILLGIGQNFYKRRQYPFLNDAHRMSISSTDSTDNTSGVGARSVTLIGLDENYEEQTETVNMHASDGTTEVLSTNSYLRIVRVIVETAGSNNANAGRIEVRQYDPNTAKAGTPQAIISIGTNQTQLAVYTVPSGKSAYVTGAQLCGSMGNNDSMLIGFFVRPFGQVFQLKYQFALEGNGNTDIYRGATVPFPIPEKSDIVFRVIELTGDDSSLSVGFDMILIEE